MFEITTPIHQPGNDPCDYHAWIKRDGINVKVQIAYTATREQAEQILADLTGNGSLRK